VNAVLSRCVLIAAVVPQLRAADVAIILDADSAIVEARYEFEPAVDTLTFNVIKVRGQQLRIRPVGNQATRMAVAELPGLYNIKVAQGMGDTPHVTLRYQITGQISRIPLPVPDSPLQPGAGSVRITLTGVGREASLRDGFPRLTREPDGSVQAQLENFPGFVRLPPNRAEWSTSRLAEETVVLLVVAGTLYWLHRRRARAPVRH
jgi:hypothetical protein